MSEPSPLLVGRRVCITGINYAPEATGIGPFTTALAHALTDAGARVRVVTGFPHYPEWRVADPYRWHLRRSENDGLVSVTRRRHWVPSEARLSGRLAMEASFLAHAMPTIHHDPSEAIIAITPSIAALGAALVARRGRPVGVVIQDLTGNGAEQSGMAGRGVASQLAHVEYAMLRRAQRIGVIARRFGDILVGQQVEPARIDFLPNFSAIRPYPGSAHQARRELGWRTDHFIVVHAGNMGRKQGLETVVEAARLADQRELAISFVLVGDGSMRRALEERARGAERLTFVPAMPATEVSRPLAAADALLVIEKPGIRDMSLPSKLTSYAVAGRPIVAAVEPGGITHADLVESAMADLVPPGDPAALLSAVERLASSATRREQLVRAAHAAALVRYAPKAAEGRYVRFAEALLGEPRAAPGR